MLYPIGIQDFESLRKGGYVYVDKTGLIWELSSTGKYYFLSRPRRFGKSLLVSTMEAYFQGKKELFEGLAIAELEKDWTAYPVLHLDLSGMDYRQERALDEAFDQVLSAWEQEFRVEKQYDLPESRFKEVIDAACRQTGRQVVILIDEYDKPLVDCLDEPVLSERYRHRLQGFYSVMKTRDASIRFGFLTGVTKMAKLSVFSGLNNLKDISMDARYTDICGISEDDLHSCFTEGVRDLAEAQGITEQECYDRLKDMYDGYHFVENSEGIYNPFSLLNAFDSKGFHEYWFSTGTPSFLVEVLKRTEYDITHLIDNTVEADREMLSGIMDTQVNPIPVLYQSGYLTIKGYDPVFGIYSLGFPNKEVRKGFINIQLGYYAPVREKEGNVLIAKLYHAVHAGRPEEMMKIFEALFAGVPYQIQGNAEKDFQYAMRLIFTLLGEYVSVEYPTSDGRMDILVQTSEYVYIIELKINASADAALSQIEQKGYARMFTGDGRKVFQIGVNFSTDTRRIEGWKVVPVAC